jgi:hypothetical protein
MTEPGETQGTTAPATTGVSAPSLDEATRRRALNELGGPVSWESPHEGRTELSPVWESFDGRLGEESLADLRERAEARDPIQVASALRDIVALTDAHAQRLEKDPTSAWRQPTDVIEELRSMRAVAWNRLVAQGVPQNDIMHALNMASPVPVATGGHANPLGADEDWADLAEFTENVREQLAGWRDNNNNAV